jgi:DNA replication and repair protein RecF
MNPLLLEHVSVCDFRNLERVELRPARRVTVVAGDNGHGKTSLIEAIYYAATSRSFRTPRLNEIVRHGAAVAAVRARLREGASLAREQVASVDQGRRVLKVDGKRPASLVSYAVRSPVVCFHTGELELSSGAAAARRTLLDRVALFLDPSSADHRERYRKAMRERQRALMVRGPEGADLPPYERLCAVHGAAVTRARQRAAAELTGGLTGLFGRLAAPGLTLAAELRPGGSVDEQEAMEQLARRRVIDRARGAPGFGPHRDDLVLLLDGHNARAVASQGQHRAITLAIKLAELQAIARARGVFPMLLLDDVSSELDRDRTAALLAVLVETEAQIFITTTRPELILTPGISGADRLDVALRGGRLLGG